MSYRLTIFPAIESGSLHESYIFETWAELTAAKNTAASLLLFIQDKAKVMDDFSNAFIEEEMTDGEWVEMS